MQYPPGLNLCNRHDWRVTRIDSAFCSDERWMRERGLESRASLTDPTTEEGHGESLVSLLCRCPVIIHPKQNACAGTHPVHTSYSLLCTAALLITAMSLRGLFCQPPSETKLFKGSVRASQRKKTPRFPLTAYTARFSTTTTLSARTARARKHPRYASARVRPASSPSRSAYAVSRGPLPPSSSAVCTYMHLCAPPPFFSADAPGSVARVHALHLPAEPGNCRGAWADAHRHHAPGAGTRRDLDQPEPSQDPGEEIQELQVCDSRR